MRFSLRTLSSSNMPGKLVAWVYKAKKALKQSSFEGEEVAQLKNMNNLSLVPVIRDPLRAKQLTNSAIIFQCFQTTPNANEFCTFYFN